MKISQKRIQNILFLVFSLFLFVQPAFQDCDDLIDIEFLFSKPAFEKPHPEDIASGQQSNRQGFESKSSSPVLFMATNPFKLISHKLFPTKPLAELTSAFRC